MSFYVTKQYSFPKYVNSIASDDLSKLIQIYQICQFSNDGLVYFIFDRIPA